MKTALRRFREAVAAGETPENLARLAGQAFKAIDKAAKTGAIHANAANRRKSTVGRLWHGAAAARG